MAACTNRKTFALRGALAAVLLLAMIAAPAIAAAPDRFEAAEARIEALANAGKTDAAIALGRKLVSAARKSLQPSDPKLATYFAELASLEAKRGRLAEAETLWRQALAVDALAAPDSKTMLARLQGLADVLAKAKGDKLLEAETLLSRALTVAEDSFGPDSAEAAEVTQSLAAVYDLEGRTAEASQLRTRVADTAQARELDENRMATAEESGNSQSKQEAPAESAQPPAAPAPPATEMPAAPSTAAPSPGLSPEPPQTEAAPPPSKPAPTLAAKRGAHLHARRNSNGGATEPEQPAPAAAAEYHVVEVFYGTNRKPAEVSARVSYTADEDDKLTLGDALITVPATHKVPEVERPWSLRVPGTEVELTFEAEDPTKHFVIKSIETLPEDQFLSRVKSRLGQSRTFKGQALVFVHGFYNSFDDALYRTAQIAYDMQFDGAAFMFSWPSAGTIDAYRSDQPKAEHAGTQLRAFLDLVAHKSGAKRITVIAHSMGNLPLMEALDETIAMDRPSPDAAIDDLVLAAPDVGRNEFAAMAGHISHIRGGVTLYAASNDLALAASRTMNGEARAGDTRPGGPLLLPHIDTIDATGASLQMFRLNHYYVAESSAVLCDLERLLSTGQHPPDARSKLLMTAGDGPERYYTFRP